MLTDDHDPLGIVDSTLENKYRILELAGEGGFSAVYKAEHLIWNEPVAIKFFSVLESAKTELREKLLGDFIQEGKLMSQLSSRSAAIVQARDIGKLELGVGTWIPYMVLEWLDGSSLDDVLRDEEAIGLPPRSIEEAVRLLEPAAIALDMAHQQSIAHRDLKPANIVIMGDAREPGVPVKVLDFGIAKVMAEHVELQEQLQLTGQQVTAFTPNYGAPEQFSRNFGATGPWSDVYAMALILVELLRGGEKALDGATFFELGVRSCDPNKRPTPRSLGVELTPEAEAVFEKALALHPANRYARMGELWAALHRALYPGADTWRAITVPLPRMSTPSQPSSFESAPTEHSQPSIEPPSSSLQTAVFDERASTPGTMAVTAPSRGRTSYVVMTGAAAAVVAAGFLLWPTEESAAPAPAAPVSAVDTEPPPSPSSAPEPAPTAPTAPTASAAASEAPSAPLASSTPPPPRPVWRPPPPRPAPTAEPKSDPWDPSTFGGRR